MEYLTALMGLVGVIIGGFLTPVLTSKIEDRRIKKNIRPQLIEKIYTFFNLRKALMATTNYHNFEKKMKHFATLEKIRQIEKPTDPRRTLLSQMILDDSDPKSRQLKAEQYFEQLVEIESKIIALICQAQQYYDEEISKKLFDIIKPEIDKSNKSSDLHPYSVLTNEELRKVTLTIDYDIYQETQKLDSDCDTLINKVMTILA